MAQIDDYIRALKLGEKAYREAVSRSEFPYIPAMDQLVGASGIQSEVSLGRMEIPLEQIAGTRTAGRQTSFAPNFMPLLKPDTEFAIKWVNLLKYQLSEGVRDPISVCEYLGRYYVVEGNKRVSVFKYIGAFSIEADVTRIVPKRSSDPQVRIFYEYMDFYKKTEIHTIWFSREGSYEKLIRLCGIEPDRVWTKEEKKRLASAYFRFSQQFRAKGGRELGITPGDAFLRYLQVHAFAGIDDKTEAQLSRETDALWPEFVLLSESPERSLLLSPWESSGANMMTRYLTGARTGKLKAAFIHNRPMAESSWVYSHELGRMYLQEAFSEKLFTQSYVVGEDAADTLEVIEQAVEDENNVIFTTSEDMLGDTVNRAYHHKNIRFLNCSLHTPSSSVRTYYGRLYEAKFLQGMIAGAMAENNRVLYETEYPYPGSVANINAFSRGAAMVNPRISVRLVRQGDDEAIQKLTREEGYRLIAGPDMPRPGSNSRSYGLYLLQDGKAETLAAPFWNWGVFYEKILRDVVTGTWKKDARKHLAMNYWWGISGGIIDLIVSQKLPSGIRALTDMVRREICENTFHPFSGVLKMQNQQTLGDGHTDITPEEIITMTELAENVVGSLP